MLSPTRIEPKAADFRLLSRPVLEVFRATCASATASSAASSSGSAFATAASSSTPPPRFAGRTNYSLVAGCCSFARTGLVSFSKLPLKVASLLGFAVSGLSLLYGLFAVFAYLFFNAP